MIKLLTLRKYSLIFYTMIAVTVLAALLSFKHRLDNTYSQAEYSLSGKDDMPVKTGLFGRDAF